MSTYICEFSLIQAMKNFFYEWIIKNETKQIDKTKSTIEEQ